MTIVGSVNEHKGHRLFLEMARRVLDIEPRAGFLVVGEDLRNNGCTAGNGDAGSGVGHLIEHCLLRLCE